MENTKTQAELLAQFPDNNLNEITAEQLRDFVVSVGVFGELKRATIGAQAPGTTAVKIDFDADGLFQSTIPAFATDDIEIQSDGIYDVRFEGSVDMQSARSFDLFVGVDGVVGMMIAHVEGQGDIATVVGGCLCPLIAGEKVSIMIQASSNGSNFFLQAGSRMKAERKL